MTTAEIISNVSNVIVGLSALAAVLIAFLGLRTWQREMRGRTEYELARRILHNVYDIRKAIHSFRKELTMGLPDKELQLQRISEIGVNLDDDFLEAQVLWSDRLEQARQTLLKYVNRLYSSVGKLRHEQEKTFPPNMLKDARRVVSGDKEDDFGKEIDAAVKAFEDAIRPILSR